MALGADGVVGVRLETQAHDFGSEIAEFVAIGTAVKAAEGIVGMQLRQHSHTWGSHTTEFLAIGTAIRPLRHDHKIERPTMVLNLEH
jgi:uncharacterized protein YbjQ (UPF0145 family)